MANLWGTDPSQYFRQLLKVATGSKVSMTESFADQKWIIGCNECGQQLHCEPMTDPTELDFGVQEFVKLHAHNGNYNPPEAKSTTQWVAEKFSDNLAKFAKPDVYAPAAQAVFGGSTDKSSVKAGIISTASKQYALAAKQQLDENVLAKKIALLQATSEEEKLKLQAQHAKWEADQEKAADQAMVNAKAVELLKLAEWKKVQVEASIAAQNAALQMKLSMLKAEAAELEVKIAKAKEPEKPLVVKTGRKFR